MVSAQTGKDGVYVPLAKVVEDIEGILTGKYDNKDPDELLFIGGIEK